MAHDREAETRATGIAGPRLVDAVEPLPDALEVARRDPDAVIAYDERDPVVDHAGADLDRLPRTRILDRVVDEIDERTAHLARVAEDLDIGRFGTAVARHGERAQVPHRPRWAVGLELALGAVPGEGVLHELGDRLLGQYLTGTRRREPPRHRVAHDLAADAVDHHDRVARFVERGEQP